jgi:hypothetical protein
MLCVLQELFAYVIRIEKERLEQEALIKGLKDTVSRQEMELIYKSFLNDHTPTPAIQFSKPTFQV